MAQWLMNPTRKHEVVGSISLASLSRLRIRCCCELWCRSQTWLGSCVALAVARGISYSSDQIPSLATSVCHGSSPRKGKKTKIKMLLL